MNTKKLLTDPRISRYASWAIWNTNCICDTGIIVDHQDLWNPYSVFVGLNMNGGKNAVPWKNFHCKEQYDGRLRDLLNNWDEYRGSFMTDIIKSSGAASSANVDLSAAKLRSDLQSFHEEMDALGKRKKRLIVFGSLAAHIMTALLIDSAVSGTGIQGMLNHQAKLKRWLIRGQEGRQKNLTNRRKYQLAIARVICEYQGTLRAHFSKCLFLDHYSYHHNDCVTAAAWVNNARKDLKKAANWKIVK